MSDNNEIIENSSEEILNDAPKRKRTRMVKKDAVYTVTGMDGESLDSKAKRQSIKKQIDAAAQKGLFDENFVSEGLQEEASSFVGFIADQGADQCGFCNPGFVMNTIALLRENPDPTDDEIRAFLSGNLCRCSGYEGQLRGIRNYLNSRVKE